MIIRYAYLELRHFPNYSNSGNSLLIIQLLFQVTEIIYDPRQDVLVVTIG